MIDGVTVTVPGVRCRSRATRSATSAPSEAVQSIDPPPVLDTATVFAAGLGPPAVAEKDSVVGVTDSTGGVGGSTVSVTGIVFGEPDTPRR